MKTTHANLLLLAFAIFIIFYFYYFESNYPVKPPPTLYECPCEASEVVNDVVRHTNKNGMPSVTTFIDIKDCLIVMPTK